MVALSVVGGTKKVKIPLLGEPPRLLVLKSGGEVIAQVTLTNRAWTHMPVGKSQVVQDALRNSVTYRGEGALTVEIESEAGHSITMVAEEIEFLR